MIYRTLGQSALKIPALVFGSWAAGGWMWGSTDEKDAVEAIHASIDLGVTAIDTAPIYGQGYSEEIVGKAIASSKRDQIQILTKFGMRWDLEHPKGDFANHSQKNDGTPIDIYKYAGKESVIYECEQSLKRLKTDYIDLYQIHWPDSTTPVSETFEAVNRLVEQGKVRYAAVCNYSNDLLEEALKTSHIISNQIPFSMVKTDNKKEVIPFCKENNLGVLAYSPLHRGLLTGKIKPDHHFEKGDHRPNLKEFQPQFILKSTEKILDKLKPIAEAKGATISQIVLLWTIQQSGITAALVGARNAKQAIINARSLSFQLTSDELKYINDLVDKF